MKKKSKLTAIVVFLFLFSLLLPLPVKASLGKAKNHLQPLTEKVEKVITRASDMYEKGQIKKGHPYVARISPRLILTFTAKNFDNDLEKAFGILDKLMTQAKKESPSKKVSKSTEKVSKSIPLKNSPPVKPAPPSDRISALRQAESQHPKRRKLTAKEVPIQYSAFKSYNALHQGRAEQEDKAAEADMQTVNRERQLAEEELQQRRARKQQVQAQAMKWQDELDKEAAESATKAAAYEAEHSFGAYVKGFLTTVLQTAVGSFTGAFIGNIGTHLADKAVGSIFHHSSSTLADAASAGTSSAINPAASATGQAVSSGATSAITRSSRTVSTPKPISSARSWKNYSTKQNINSSKKKVWVKPVRVTRKPPRHIIKCATPLIQKHYRPVIRKVKY